MTQMGTTLEVHARHTAAMRETPMTLSAPLRAGVAAERARHQRRDVRVLLAVAVVIAVGSLVAVRWFDDTQARDGVQVLHALPQTSADNELTATSSVAYPFATGDQSPNVAPRDALLATNVPPGVTRKQWQTLVAKASTRPDGAQEMARLEASYRFTDALRQFRDLARSDIDRATQVSQERAAPGLVSLATQINVQLDAQFAQRGITLSDAAEVKAALLAVLEPDADRANVALEHWVQAQSRARSDDLRDALKRSPEFARRHAEVVKAWHTQPPLRRDPKAIERDLERLHVEMFGGTSR